MKRRHGALIACLAAAGAVSIAGAVPPGFKLDFHGGEEGRVEFTGDVHSGTGMYCADCHMAVFDVARHSRISWEDHRREVYCFTCHNGETAFAPRRNCTNCHVEDPDADY